MAVYTDVSDEALAQFLTLYDIGTLVSCKGIAEGVENSNYLLGTDQGNFILTLYEKRVDTDDLPFFLGLMDHLAAKDLACPVPIHDRSGKALNTLEGRPAAIISFLNGMWAKNPHTEQCIMVGAALAEFHDKGEDFTIRRANALNQPAWKPLFAQSATRADEVQIGLRSAIETELDYLAANWPQNLPGGVIHADLFPDNVFFLGGTFSGMIDFYFACNDMLAYDLAICLNAWCFEKDNAFNITKGRALIEGYQSVRPLSADELAALPVLARGAAMRFFLTRLHDWIRVPPGALVVPKNPLEYVKKLRFHQQVETASAYGIDL
ncbi:MAG: homoserine kinase [Hyphomicrobiales bacterium]|nr:homoserine kinase [Hyphomicrobiales bacterium]PCJ84734.1 MAG: homoserine kinase [Hyphomicrobiales bacterium]